MGADFKGIRIAEMAEPQHLNCSTVMLSQQKIKQQETTGRFPSNNTGPAEIDLSLKKTLGNGKKNEISV